LVQLLLQLLQLLLQLGLLLQFLPQQLLAANPATAAAETLASTAYK
jgi:hypothetical protein